MVLIFIGQTVVICKLDTKMYICKFGKCLYFSAKKKKNIRLTSFVVTPQGDQQWVFLEFPEPVKVSELRLQFQGGFSGRSCKLEGCNKEGNLEHIEDFYPEDDNSLQSFPIQDAPLVQKVKIVFKNSTDFFGRIVVYSLDILGERSS
uniref:Nuclear receptor 2C2-associated protein n=1 Tax=Astyanax mexicanus TaxID=7994 RepID=A0A3B1JSL7_ASTMX